MARMVMVKPLKSLHGSYYNEQDVVNSNQVRDVNSLRDRNGV